MRSDVVGSAGVEPEIGPLEQPRVQRLPVRPQVILGPVRGPPWRGELAGGNPRAPVIELCPHPVEWHTFFTRNMPHFKPCGGANLAHLFGNKLNLSAAGCQKCVIREQGVRIWNTWYVIPCCYWAANPRNSIPTEISILVKQVLRSD